MSSPSVRRRLKSEAQSSALAARIAPMLGPGDCLLLEGPIGAGKSHFARALIQERLPEPEDVPSPTFTLVQTYDAGDAEIWHCDLYRLTDPDEVMELGLEEALEEAICIIEWPDRLGPLRPAGALTLAFALTGDDGERVLTATGNGPRWTPVLEEIRD